MPTRGQKPPELEGYTHEQIMELYKQIQAGNIPQELLNIDKFTDKNGKPIIDDEGGATIQPLAGFVVKTKDQSGQKIFVNMTHHDLIEGV